MGLSEIPGSCVEATAACTVLCQAAAAGCTPLKDCELLCDSAAAASEFAFKGQTAQAPQHMEQHTASVQLLYSHIHHINQLISPACCHSCSHCKSRPLPPPLLLVTLTRRNPCSDTRSRSGRTRPGLQTAAACLQTCTCGYSPLLLPSQPGRLHTESESLDDSACWPVRLHAPCEA